MDERYGKKAFTNSEGKSAEADGGGNKRKVTQAIALEYNPSEDAPRVIASGRGILAEKIIQKAKESDVPIHRDDKLADTLSRLEIGDMIPPELYEVVAEILIFVDSMDKLKKKL
ncbi:MAG: EscU/YscU/HrcU family type III secretion system export apparatus switch protein [bacterium]|nr:EscU/YscU/HrcU family type III secretion system export apparatus switch protein [bacterium]